MQCVNQLSDFKDCQPEILLGQQQQTSTFYLEKLTLFLHWRSSLSCRAGHPCNSSDSVHGICDRTVCDSTWFGHRTQSTPSTSLVSGAVLL